MITPNLFYSDLKDSYLFYNIAQKTKAYLSEHPNAHLYRMGIGDVSLPLCESVIKALHEAVDDQAQAATGKQWPKIQPIEARIPAISSLGNSHLASLKEI